MSRFFTIKGELIDASKFARIRKHGKRSICFLKELEFGHRKGIQFLFFNQERRDAAFDLMISELDADEIEGVSEDYKLLDGDYHGDMNREMEQNEEGGTYEED